MYKTISGSYYETLKVSYIYCSKLLKKANWFRANELYTSWDSPFQGAVLEVMLTGLFLYIVANNKDTKKKKISHRRLMLTMC